MAGISAKALGYISPENWIKFNGIENNSALDLNFYEAFFRTYDCQIGRFLQIDPKIGSFENFSPYLSFFANPIRFSDPLGDSTIVPSNNRLISENTCQGCSQIRERITVEKSGGFGKSRSKSGNIGNLTGGIPMSSEDGQGGGRKGENVKEKAVNIDGLVAAIGGILKLSNFKGAELPSMEEIGDLGLEFDKLLEARNNPKSNLRDKDNDSKILPEEKKEGESPIKPNTIYYSRYLGQNLRKNADGTSDCCQGDKIATDTFPRKK